MIDCEGKVVQNYIYPQSFAGGPLELVPQLLSSFEVEQAGTNGTCACATTWPLGRHGVEAHLLPENNNRRVQVNLCILVESPQKAFKIFSSLGSSHEIQASKRTRTGGNQTNIEVLLRGI